MPNFTIDLGGAWKLQRAGNGRRFPAIVPGCVHTDLLKAGAIEDPFYRDNELKVKWIGEADWIYSRSFSAGDEDPGARPGAAPVQGAGHVRGRDGQRAAGGRGGQHVPALGIRHQAGAAPRREPHQHPVQFRAAVHSAEAEERSLPSWGGPNEVAGRAWVRKEPCNFGWDWAPVLVTAGIWRAISIEAFDVARIADLHITQEHSRSGAVTLRMRADVEGAARAATTHAPRHGPLPG